MLIVEFAVLITTLLGTMLGGFCIYWVKVRPSARQAWWGSCLFIVTLFVLGAAGLVAALTRADGLSSLGLLSGLLIVGMLWESPVPLAQDESSSTTG